MENEHLNNHHLNFPDPSPPPGLPGPRKLFVHLLLFVITVFTTMIIGASNLGHSADEWFLNDSGFQVFLNFLAFKWVPDFATILKGWEYAFALLTILTCHEMGHYLAARWHKMNVTLPYYIPLPIPPILFHFGTMGAFIRIKSPIRDRTVLMDVAVAGPIAGFIPSLIFLFYGYATIPSMEAVVQHVETIHPWPDGTGPNAGFALTMGHSLLFWVFNEVIGKGYVPMSEIYHFPYIFSGWIGFFITALNLIPISQLDGGHTVYALFGRKADKINYAAYALLGFLTIFLFWHWGEIGAIWVFWMIILQVIGIKHPPTLYDYLPISRNRKLLGWTCIVIFILCFIPLPVYFS